MKINEVEKLLDIPKASIRFYEKEGLLNPKRNVNSYREYSDDDVELLKKVMVLRKIGVPVEDIKYMQGLNNIYVPDIDNLDFKEYDKSVLRKFSFDYGYIC